MGETGYAKRILVGKHLFGSQRRREDNTKPDLRISCEDWRWTELPQDSVHWQALVLAVNSFVSFHSQPYEG
jgi:hypothetical protein